MKIVSFSVVAAALAVSVAGGHQSPRPQVLAITNVSVIPMDTERVLSDHTVLVSEGRITSVVGANEAPTGATVIDGTGKYLIPGLADLHVHLRQWQVLPVYLSEGVTTVLDMGAGRAVLDWRQQLEDGEIVGPRLFASYFVDGPNGGYNVVGTTEEARAAVAAAVEDGWDYIKVYNSLTTRQFDAILEESRAKDIAVVGHAVREPGIEHGLRNGQKAVAHAEEFIYSVFNNTTNRAQIPEVVAMVKETGAFVIPNLSAYEVISRQWGRPEVVEGFFGEAEARWLHADYQEYWRRDRYTNRRGSLAPRVQFLKELTKAFQDSGVPLLAGTDSPVIPGMFAGASLHGDLALMVDAGLTPFEALSAATRSAGLFLAETHRSTPDLGVIRPGAVADLVLLDGNPLEDIGNARKLAGVMKGGRYWTARQLREHLESVYPDRTAR